MARMRGDYDSDEDDTKKKQRTGGMRINHIQPKKPLNRQLYLLLLMRKCIHTEREADGPKPWHIQNNHTIFCVINTCVLQFLFYYYNKNTP